MKPTANIRGAGLLRFWILGVLVAGLPAQNDKDESAAKAAAESPSPSQLTLATISSEACQVRCFASNLSPVYEARLEQGTVVQVGEEVGEFRRVVLPLGVIGFVSKHFTTEPAEGLIKTVRKRVSFRYRPTPKNHAEAPVQILAEDTSLHYIGEVGDWWKVRLVTESAYLPIKAIAVAAESTAEMRKSYAQLINAHEAEWRKAAAGYGAKIAAAVATKRRTERMGELRLAFHDETNKDLKDQKLPPILAELTKLIADLPEESPNLEAAKFLASAIEHQQVFVDAAIVLSTKEPAAPKPKVQITETPVDKIGSRLQTTGWLTYHPAAGGPSAFRLEKGGRVISYLYCNSLRYDLAMFEGVEIGVRGVRRQDAVVPYLDVRRIEVLGHVK